ncbi:MAG TPA: 3'(2'),5'-bisphosphate nucleotidase CysQ [Chitinophagales bacterium]|nr:3'(2'),5'-bisphosphate nucleotidase CysQ [Chitinophagales bacterium]
MNYGDIDLEQLVSIARKAGDEIMQVYSCPFAVEIKDDKSPLTEADKRSNAVIIQGLQQLYPGIPYISEETKQTAYNERKNWERCWMIDPLDGTKEFIKKNGEFTVNIALIKNGAPVLGVVHAPALQKTYFGFEGGGSFAFNNTTGQFETILNTQHYSQKNKVVVVASRSHLSEETLQFVEQLKAEGKEVDFISSGSSLKFCLVAEGKADVYPRFGPTMEWDTAAAHAVALNAGHNVLNYETGTPLTYNKENLLNPWFIVA